MMLRVLKSWRYIVGFLRNTLLLERVHIPPWEYRTIIDSKVSAGRGYASPRVSKIPAVLGPRAGQQKTRQADAGVPWSLCLSKCVPPQHHVHPFGWNAGAALPGVPHHGEKLNLWIWHPSHTIQSLSKFASWNFKSLTEAKRLKNSSTMTQFSHFFHPKKSNQDYLDLLTTHSHLFGTSQKNQANPPIPIPSWWLNQPLWKICSSNWIISPGIGVKIKDIWNHHLDSPSPPSHLKGTNAKCWFVSSSSCTARVQTEESDQRRVFQTSKIHIGDGSVMQQIWEP